MKHSEILMKEVTRLGTAILQSLRTDADGWLFVAGSEDEHYRFVHHATGLTLVSAGDDGPELVNPGIQFSVRQMCEIDHEAKCLIARQQASKMEVHLATTELVAAVSAVNAGAGT